MPGTFRPLLSYPEFNGHRLSRTSCQLRFAPLAPAAALVVSGWKSISTKEELTPGETYGNRAKMQGRTRGKHKATVDIEIYAEDAEIVRVALSAAGTQLGMGWMEVPFAISLTAFEKVLGGAFLWEAMGCRIVSEELSVGDNDDQLARKWSLNCQDMRTNGLSAVLEATATGLPG
jgi:hypothetical protein